MAEEFNDIIKNCENLVRAGMDAEVVHMINGLLEKPVPRVYRLPLANLSRRIGQIRSGLKLLAPVVRPERKIASFPSEQEIAEYAMLLQRNGSLHEALRLLTSINSDKLPEVLLYQAFCHFNMWSYKEAVPLLDKYLSYPLADYAKLIGRVNLAAALVITNEFERALEILKICLEESEAGGWHRLQGNCFELRAQVHIATHDFNEAKVDLDHALNIFKKVQGLDQLFVLKWRAILQSQVEKNPAALLEFKERALKSKDWESCREAALFELKSKSLAGTLINGEMEYLYFGSPFQGYRERIASTLEFVPQSMNYRFGSAIGSKFNILTGELDGKKVKKTGQRTHQFLDLLLRDFYRPASLGGLFSELFPDEYFDIFSSPNRVHQIMWRTRSWLKELEIPVLIQEDSSSYCVQIDGKFGFEIPLNRKLPEVNEISLIRLLDAFKSDPLFTSTAAREKLAISPAQYKSFSRWAIEKGHIEKIGAGSGTLYQLKCFDKLKSVA